MALYPVGESISISTSVAEAVVDGGGHLAVKVWEVSRNTIVAAKERKTIASPTLTRFIVIPPLPAYKLFKILRSGRGSRSGDRSGFFIFGKVFPHPQCQRHPEGIQSGPCDPQGQRPVRRLRRCFERSEFSIGEVECGAASTGVAGHTPNNVIGNAASSVFLNHSGLREKLPALAGRGIAGRAQRDTLDGMYLTAV